MSVKWGTYIQRSGTIKSVHTINLRSADKWSTPPPAGKKVISIIRQPARGPPYTIRFVMLGATEEETGDDLLRNWLLPRIEEQQRVVGTRMGLPHDSVDPRYQSCSTSSDGAGALLKAVRKWMATEYQKPGTKSRIHTHTHTFTS